MILRSVTNVDMVSVSIRFKQPENCPSWSITIPVHCSSKTARIVVTGLQPAQFLYIDYKTRRAVKILSETVQYLYVTAII